MTAMISIFVMPQALLTTYIYWVALLTLLVSLGAGALSVDNVIRKIAPGEVLDRRGRGFAKGIDHRPRDGGARRRRAVVCENRRRAPRSAALTEAAGVTEAAAAEKARPPTVIRMAQLAVSQPYMFDYERGPRIIQVPPRGDNAQERGQERGIVRPVSGPRRAPASSAVLNWR